MTVVDVVGWTVLAIVVAAVLILVVWRGIDLAARGKWQAWLILGPLFVAWLAADVWLIWLTGRGLAW